METPPPTKSKPTPLQVSHVHKAQPPLISAFGKDEQFWWTSTASILARLMNHCGYNEHDVNAYMALYSQLVLPALGPRPEQLTNKPFWRSFMTDDFSPIEYSVNFTSTGRTVRFAIEPISACAGTSADPFNRIAPEEFLHCISPLVASGADMRMYDHFLGDGDMATHLPHYEHASQVFVGFDLDHGCSDGNLIPKVYLMPSIRAAATGFTSLDLVSHAIQTLEIPGEGTNTDMVHAWAVVQGYITSQPAKSTPQVEMVSFDCVYPRSSRIKIYVRSPHMSLAVAKDMFTLGGRIHLGDEAGSLESALQNLEDLWNLSLGLAPGTPEDEEVHPRDESHANHRTGGVIFNYELRPGQSYPQAQLYIPVRHYGTIDASVARGLATFFRRLGWESYANEYASGLEDIFPRHPLERTTGTQTYISFAYKKDKGAYISVYYSPRIF
ncbi:aromatic prenyltransferase [Aspergillus californicus]